MPARRTRQRLRVTGVVQGVGYRPFVHRLAQELGLVGQVGNDARGVVVEVEGPDEAVLALRTRLASQAPALAQVDEVRVEADLPTREQDGFRIVASDGAGPRTTLVAPDTATCPECLEELHRPDNRRRRHALVNCTNCGPRLSIVLDTPYDRDRTTMRGFAMCDACAAEYGDPSDRRFHAQPTCCLRCGPRLWWWSSEAGDHPEPAAGHGDDVALRAAAAAIRAGEVVAVKGVGGWHLAARAADEGAVDLLRRRKQRDDKPFAVMVADLAHAHRLAVVDQAASELLTSPASPIVLLERRADADLAPGVAPATRRIGVMLPCTGLHHLLLAEVGEPIVLTSGNRVHEPMVVDDDAALGGLAGLSTGWLGHDRPIHTRVDDSVATVVDGSPLLLRRSRGYAPTPIRLPAAAPRHLLAVGAQLKNTFALVRDDLAFVSPHVGDLDELAAFTAFTDGIDHYRRLFEVTPEVVAHDLHPEYLSTKHALDLGLEAVAVQHHHAHVASCLVDNQHVGPVIGVAFDGTGLGTDGDLWGGEILLADLRGFERLGHLAPTTLPGGEGAIRNPWRMAASHLVAAGVDAPVDVRDRNLEHWDAVTSLCRPDGTSPTTTSVGRLFDAIAALLGVRDDITYEGQAAIELEQRCADDPGPELMVGLDDPEGQPFQFTVDLLVRQVVDALADGHATGAVATAFHRAVSRMVVDGCVLARERTGAGTVALTGGVFQNVRLLQAARRGLQDAGFTVLVHRRVPPNDGGICVGQAVVAATLLA